MFKTCKYKNLYKIANSLNATKMITNMVAFRPPQKSLYKLVKDSKKKSDTFNGDCYNIKYEKMKFIHDIYSNIQYPWIELEAYLIQRLKRKNSKLNGQEKLKTEEVINDKKIAILIVKNKHAKNNIIFSHGNSSTLGTIYPFLIDMSTQLKSNIICYDYQGYGESQGKCSESVIYQNIEDVVEFCKNLQTIKLKKVNKEENNNNHNNPENTFILIGHSLGSAPSVHIASKFSCNSNLIRAMILVSPIASTFKFFDDEKKDLIGIEKFDIFCNIKKIQEVISPVFLIHGKKDEIIPFKHSEEMLKYIKTKLFWFPKNADHCNIFSQYRTKFFNKCNSFLDNLFCFESRKNNVSRNSYDNSFRFLQSNQTLNKNKNNMTNTTPFDLAELNGGRRGSYLCNNFFDGKIIGNQAQTYENEIDNFAEHNNYYENQIDDLYTEFSTDKLNDLSDYTNSDNNTNSQNQIFYNFKNLKIDKIKLDDCVEGLDEFSDNKDSIIYKKDIANFQQREEENGRPSNISKFTRNSIDSLRYGASISDEKYYKNSYCYDQRNCDRCVNIFQGNNIEKFENGCFCRKKKNNTNNIIFKCVTNYSKDDYDILK